MRVEVPCELDAEGVRSSRTVLEKCIDVSGDVTLDLRGVSRMDSSGLGLLVYLQKRKLEKGFAFAIQNVAGQPLELLICFNLLDVFGCVGSVADVRPIEKPAVV